ncbi:MAG TPA: DinB family protein [Sediminibacterium sp.]|nr:DinB family protein [Sediminibacterium sp.]
MQTTRQLLQSLRTTLEEMDQYFHQTISVQPVAVLAQTPENGGWSVAQVLDHLNFYSRWYLPRLEDAFRESRKKNLAAQPYFKSGWMGGYFTRLMKPGSDGSIASKMKAPANAAPAAIVDSTAVLVEFEQHLQHLNSLLRLAEKADLAHIRVTTSLSSFIRLKTGDTLCFVLAHAERHFVQIKRAIHQ